MARHFDTLYVLGVALVRQLGPVCLAPLAWLSVSQMHYSRCFLRHWIQDYHQKLLEEYLSVCCIYVGPVEG